jgi:hypothetical protein
MRRGGYEKMLEKREVGKVWLLPLSLLVCVCATTHASALMVRMTGHTSVPGRKQGKDRDGTAQAQSDAT